MNIPKLKKKTEAGANLICSYGSTFLSDNYIGLDFKKIIEINDLFLMCFIKKKTRK